MRVFLDLYCSCGYHDDVWTGNWTSDDVWNRNHSHFKARIESDVYAGLFTASIKLICNIECKGCGNSLRYWIEYGSLSDGGPDYKYFNCCGHELKLKFEKYAF